MIPSRSWEHSQLAAGMIVTAGVIPTASQNVCRWSPDIDLLLFSYYCYHHHSNHVPSTSRKKISCRQKMEKRYQLSSFTTNYYALLWIVAAWFESFVYRLFACHLSYPIFYHLFFLQIWRTRSFCTLRPSPMKRMCCTRTSYAGEAYTVCRWSSSIWFRCARCMKLMVFVSILHKKCRQRIKPMTSSTSEIDNIIFFIVWSRYQSEKDTSFGTSDNESLSDFVVLKIWWWSKRRWVEDGGFRSGQKRKWCESTFLTYTSL